MPAVTTARPTPPSRLLTNQGHRRTPVTHPSEPAHRRTLVTHPMMSVASPTTPAPRIGETPLTLPATPSGGIRTTDRTLPTAATVPTMLPTLTRTMTLARLTRTMTLARLML